jgi:hypothetical protein
MYTGKNRLMRAIESPNRTLMRLSEHFLKLVSVFKEARKNFKLVFFLKYRGYKFKNQAHAHKSTVLIVYCRPSKKYSNW